ncbi:MAG: ribonuclease HII [Ignavibacteria bacterium GWA2_55_25]|nr:MAG: ribonuclease HII [Ignavibacteria bacterium GWA2_55_25]
MEKIAARDMLFFERKYWSEGVEIIAGVDEAGRGPLAGPVVAAAVVFPKEVYLEGVDDSKKLSPHRREQLFPLIHERALGVGIGVVSHEEIDRINIYQASILAMKKALDQLSMVPSLVLADGNSFRHETLRFENIIKGDARSFTIATASIIAKVTRDGLMREYDRLFPGYGFAKHKGYGTREHVEAIRRNGLCEIHRRSFKVAL